MINNVSASYEQIQIDSRARARVCVPSRFHGLIRKTISTFAPPFFRHRESAVSIGDPRDDRDSRKQGSDRFASRSEMAIPFACPRASNWLAHLDRRNALVAPSGAIVVADHKSPGNSTPIILLRVRHAETRRTRRTSPARYRPRSTMEPRRRLCR